MRIEVQSCPITPVALRCLVPLGAGGDILPQEARCCIGVCCLLHSICALWVREVWNKAEVKMLRVLLARLINALFELHRFDGFCCTRLPHTTFGSVTAIIASFLSFRQLVNSIVKD